MWLEVGLAIGGDWWKTEPSLHLETVSQWKSMLHVHWEDAAGVKGLQPIYTEEVSQMTVGPSRELNTYLHQDL